MTSIVESKMWLRTASLRELKAIAAASGGYGVDAFDFMVYTFVIPTLIAMWHMSSVQAGWIATAALLASAVGGWVAGIAADRRRDDEKVARRVSRSASIATKGRCFTC